MSPPTIGAAGRRGWVGAAVTTGAGRWVLKDPGAAPDTQGMQCHRCGETAVVKRAEAYYCGKCALTRDWQEIIGMVQDARVEDPVAGLDEDPAPGTLAAPAEYADPFS